MNAPRLSPVAIGLVGLLGAFGGSPIDATGSAWAGEGHGHGMPHAAMPMQHGTIEVGGMPAPPAVKVEVHQDPKAGWNLRVQAENFRFAPEHASTAHIAGEGHAHLFVDGKKLLS